MAKAGVRIAVTLACTECKRRNYQSSKSKRNTPDRLVRESAGLLGLELELAVGGLVDVIVGV